ncbi:hypothetical protein FQE14_08180 [Salmonella enterica]|uniref:Uncharacterized protein n=2 Tax=Salmonella enterica I TaxID=59201 RepID=A0A3V3S3P3_SALET|nr:hypothetical protein [Salmonella enterica subsp. arizonae]EAA7637329.1 hypothetical protein [Salmonella enterica subsp. enterica]EAA9183930.1 hypothetical protein [Salmonella enterica]EAO5639448.1 hypothetical protein [Salmonella enterica subsp. enterica serovar Alachua]ECT7525216.1 hypothetical protein [Salmonella enterica subsp. enterica serovar Anatum]EDW4325600.1 hypothetical protein [Salmonella enterica subsp. enterica serovar Cerro]
MGAVYDSIGQGGDYASTAGAERKNCLCVKKDFCESGLPRFACLLPTFWQQSHQKIGRDDLAIFRLMVAGRPDLLWRNT